MVPPEQHPPGWGSGRGRWAALQSPRFIQRPARRGKQALRLLGLLSPTGAHFSFAIFRDKWSCLFPSPAPVLRDRHESLTQMKRRHPRGRAAEFGWGSGSPPFSRLCSDAPAGHSIPGPWPLPGEAELCFGPAGGVCRPHT